MPSFIQNIFIKCRMADLIDIVKRDKSVKIANAKKALSRVAKNSEHWYCCELWIRALELKINSTIVKMMTTKKYTADIAQVIDLADKLELYYHYVMRKLMDIIIKIGNGQEKKVAVRPIDMF